MPITMPLSIIPHAYTMWGKTERLLGLYFVSRESNEKFIKMKYQIKQVLFSLGYNTNFYNFIIALQLKRIKDVGFIHISRADIYTDILYK